MHRFSSPLASSSSGRAEQPASASSSSLLRNAEWPASVGSSTDRADVQTDPAADEDPVLTYLEERQRKRAIEREAEREGEHLAKPMPLAEKMEELLQQARRQRELQSDRLRRSSSSRRRVNTDMHMDDDDMIHI